MIQTINPIEYYFDKRTEKSLVGVVTETVLNYVRLPLEKKYSIEVLYLVDGKAWKREIYYFSYAEIDNLKQIVLASNNFSNLTGSELEDAILKQGLLLVAIQDTHFGLSANAWRVMTNEEDLFAKDAPINYSPPLEVQ